MLATQRSHAQTLAGPPSATFFSLAQQHFKAQNYDAATRYYRKHLRKNRRDFSAWLQLAASYYHLGLPEKALRYLKRFERATKQKSYNFYYQGLAYLALNRPISAMDYFASCARFIDEYGSRCTFERAVYAYNSKNTTESLYWLNLYVRRYPNGTYAKTAHKMGTSLEDGRFIDGVEASKKPDIAAALYKHHSLSLSNRPHFWFLQGGGEFTLGTQNNPTPQGKLEESDVSKYAIVLAAGVGIGPVESDDSSLTAGYIYRQHWFTEDSRLQTYAEDFSDLEYQPFRADLMERRHQLFADFRKNFGSNFFLGSYGTMEYGRVGSTIIPSVDADDYDESQALFETTTIVPWLGFTYLKNYETLAYLFFRKELNEIAPEKSNKTFQFDDEFVMSFGLSQYISFPDNGVQFNFDLFQYEFVYNDLWDDYIRRGVLAGTEFQFVPNVFMKVSLGYFQDSYLVPMLKQESCSFKPKGTGSNEQASALFQGVDTEQPNFPQKCTRSDTGFLVRLGTHWNMATFWRLDFWYTMVQNRSANQELFDETRNTIEVGVTFAFPSPDFVVRYTHRLLETAITKEGQ